MITHKAKYFRSAKTNHIMPANVSNKKYNEVLNIAEKAHKILRCKGVTRSDFKYFNDEFYLLEINTQPGMTDLSLVPEIANYKNISFDKLVKKLILDASLNKMKKFLIILSSIILIATLTTFNPNKLNFDLKLFKIEKIELKNVEILSVQKLKRLFKSELSQTSLLIIDNENK